MSAIEITSMALNIVVIGTLILWLGVANRLWLIARTKPTIREGLGLPVPEDVQVSIIVPTHNEERVVDRCVSSLRSQSHKNIQIIFVLDRCTDRTLEILQNHSSEDDRIMLIENDLCPEDWAGKCNAAKIGASKATGDWLLFTDADTQFDEQLVHCAIASALKRGASLLSILSSLTITKNYERIVQPIASTCLLRNFPVDRINGEHRTRPFANGQFLLFTKVAYDAVGGHDAVKDDLLEDIALARAVHKSGLRVQVLFADGLLKCSMYATFSAFQNGWKRIYIESCNRKVKKLKQNATTIVMVGDVLPAIGIIGIIVGKATSPTLFWTSIASLIISASVIAWLYRINRAPVIFTIFAPFGALVVAKLFRDAARTLQKKESICWGGKEYILEPRL
ncbi:MAG: glycosyltransferase family 2 protein [Planctomycetota bacterium]|nr:glycosyltransferase family 2 protein [Planctomycetota bacterium]